MCTIVELYRTLSGHNAITHDLQSDSLLYDSQALYKALVQFWMKRYPSALLKTVPTYLASEPAQIDSPLTYFKVSLLLWYLRNLVTMGIDKCKGRVVLVCPVLL